MLYFPYKSKHHSSVCDETFTNSCKYTHGGFGNLKNLKIVLAGVLNVALGAHIVHPFAMKLSQVLVNMPTVVLVILKIFKLY